MLTCCAVRILLPHGSGNDISKNKPSSKIEGSDFGFPNGLPIVNQVYRLKKNRTSKTNLDRRTECSISRAGIYIFWNEAVKASIKLNILKILKYPKQLKVSLNNNSSFLQKQFI